MNEMFKGLTVIDEKEEQNVIDNALIVLDTNILLKLYKYTKETAQEMIKLLEHYKNKIWITYRIGEEYFKNRDNVAQNTIEDLIKCKKEVEESFNKTKDSINKQVSKVTEMKNIRDSVIEEKQAIISKINDIINLQEKENISRKKEIEKNILDIVGKKVTAELEPSDRKQVIIEGDRRIKENIPPGYKDKEKSEKEDSYIVNGDYIIFYEMIQLAKSKNKDIVFITDDRKEDWINKNNNLGRPELLMEFSKLTGQRLIIMSSKELIEKYNKIINKMNKIDENALDEVSSLGNDLVNDNYKKIMELYVYNMMDNYLKNNYFKEKKHSQSEIKKIMETYKSLRDFYYYDLINKETLNNIINIATENAINEDEIEEDLPEQN